jgi:hypothetical protein
MNNRSILPILLLGSLITVPLAFGQEDPCAGAQARLNARLAEISSHLERQTAVRKKQMEAEISKLQGQAPDTEGDPTVAVTKLHFKVTSHNQEIILGLPDVTMKDQKMILKLPDVTMKDQTFGWDRPAIKMVNVQTGEYPEFTCEHFACSVKFSPIITSVPQPIMVHEQAIIGVPEFSMRDNTIIMGIPEFSIREQKIILTIPDFTLEDIEAQANWVQTSSNDLSQRMQNDMKNLVTQAKSDAEKASVTEISQMFACQGQELENKEKAALAEIDRQSAVIQASLAKAQQVGATEMAAQMQDTLTKLNASRAEVVKQFDAARKQIADAKKKTFSAGGLQTQSTPASRPGPYSFQTLTFETE